MAKRINKTGVILFITALLSLLLGINQAHTANWSKILKEAKKRYAASENQVKDMTIVTETKRIMPHEKETTSDVKILSKGEKVRMEVTSRTRDMKTIIIYDGKDTWMISSLMGKKKIPGGEKKQHKAESWWKWISEDAKIVGTEKIGKRKCYVVDLKGEKQSPFTKIFLDKKNLELVKSEIKGQKEKKLFILYSDFRKVKGKWRIPYKIDTYVEGKLVSVATFKSVETNKGVSDSLFDPDKVKVKTKGINIEEIMKKLKQQKESKKGESKK